MPVAMSGSGNLDLAGCNRTSYEEVVFATTLEMRARRGRGNVALTSLQGPLPRSAKSRLHAESGSLNWIVCFLALVPCVRQLTLTEMRPSRPTPLRDGPSALVNSLCLAGGRARLNPVYLSTFRPLVSSLVIIFGNALIPPFFETHSIAPALRASSSKLRSISGVAIMIGMCRR